MNPDFPGSMAKGFTNTISEPSYIADSRAFGIASPWLFSTSISLLIASPNSLPSNTIIILLIVSPCTLIFNTINSS